MQIADVHPWICAPDARDTVELFLLRGRKVQIARNDVVSVGGRASDIYFFKTGAVLVFADDHEDYWVESPRALGIYLPGRILGAVVSIHDKTAQLYGRALQPVEALTLPLSVFQHRVLADSRLYAAATHDAVSKLSAHNKGLRANLHLEPPARLLLLLRTLFAAFELDIRDGWNVVPLNLSTIDYGMVVHTTRITVSRVFGDWKRRRLLRRTGHAVEVHSTLFRTGDQAPVRALADMSA